MELSRLRQPVIGAFAVLLISGAGVAFAGTGSPAVIASDTTVSAPGAGQVEAAGTDTDTDNLQVGDQTSADGVTDVAGAEAAGAEAAGTEAASADSDGPGGHADDPSDANADHQFDGNE